MKFRYLFLIFAMFFVFGASVNASKIDYNLRIDNNLHFYETITYDIDKKDVKNGNNYDFLTSVVNDTIYFDLKEEVPYKKTKKTTSNGYIVKLRNDYSSIFLPKSRILKECFTKFDFDTEVNKIDFSASEFYCSHRADNIQVLIVTDLEVTHHNASVVNGNTYTWKNINKEFAMEFTAKVPSGVDEFEPLDENHAEHDDNSNNSNNGSNDPNKNNNEKSKQTTEKESSFNWIIVPIIVGSIFLIVIVLFFVLQAKKRKANEL